MSAVSSADHSSFDSDFARAISRRFEHGRLLVIGGHSRELESQFAEAGREADLWSPDELASRLYWHDVPGKIDMGGQGIMEQRWAGVLHGDAYYNPNLSREGADFSLGK
jgi:hypothetical protein